MSTNAYKIAVIAGDGIGKEVMPEAIKVLEAVAGKHDLDFKFDEKMDEMLRYNFADVGDGRLERGAPLCIIPDAGAR